MHPTMICGWLITDLFVNINRECVAIFFCCLEQLTKVLRNGLFMEETIPVIARRPLADVAISVNDSLLVAEIATARKARLAMTLEVSQEH